jgi:aspartyl-tRNA(Asn)/glutamyl-tRNA(Gln) amidotransferase subunit C
MAINKADIIHVGKLARLRLDPDAVDLYERQLGDVLSYMETLNRLETDGVTPTSHVVSVKNVFREDLVTPSVSPETGLANAPEVEDTTFVVPKIIE